jgi:hypothetical protein
MNLVTTGTLSVTFSQTAKENVIYIGEKICVVVCYHILQVGQRQKIIKREPLHEKRKLNEVTML